MKKKLLLSAFLILAGFYGLIQTQANAQNQLSFALGYYDLEHSNDGTNFRLEYKALNLKLLGKISPFAGVEITNKGSLWIGAGFLTEFKLDKKWSITPNIGIGYYSNGKNDLDLGHPIEFKTGIELSYALENKNRIGLNFTHLSNGGLGDTNPGTEIISLTYSFPFDKLF